jgi:hypothetical protein
VRNDPGGFFMCIIALMYKRQVEFLAAIQGLSLEKNEKELE